MPNTPPALVASGAVLPFRGVKLSGEHTGAQTTANDAGIGIARGSTRNAPLEGLVTTNNHANTGDPISLIGDGEIGLAEVGAAVTAGDKLKSDANGKLVAIATSGGATQNVIAVALEDGAADGVKIRVQVQLGAEEAPA